MMLQTLENLLPSTDWTTPIVQMKVFTGEASYAYLPRRCSEINISENDIYTWTQTKPDITNEVTSQMTLSLLNQQVIQQNHEAGVNSTICTEGTGEACESDIIAVGTATFTKYGSSLPKTNCVTRSLTNAISSQNTTVDMQSGLPTAQVQQVKNYISWDIGSNVASSGDKMLTPFPTLHKLKQLNGAGINIELSQQTSNYAVNSAAYIDNQYPTNTENPTKEVPVTYTYPSTENQAVVWALIVWCVVLTLSLVGIIYPIMAINSDKTGEMSASIAYETLKDKHTDDAEHAL